MKEWNEWEWLQFGWLLTFGAFLAFLLFVSMMAGAA